MLEDQFSHSDADLRKILEQAQVIAMVGASDDHYYTSYQVAQYLKEMGYRVYPVNPNIGSVDGVRSYDSLAEVPEPIDVVNVFRDPVHLKEIVEEAIAAGAKAVWAQLGVVSSTQEAERLAVESGLKMVSNRCMRTEHERLQIAEKSSGNAESE